MSKQNRLSLSFRAATLTAAMLGLPQIAQAQYYYPRNAWMSANPVNFYPGYIGPQAWYNGELIVQCGPYNVLGGLSFNTNPSNLAVHKGSCDSESLYYIFATDDNLCHKVSTPAPAPGPAGYPYDWDPGYFKFECGRNEAIKGIGLSPYATQTITSILCCPLSPSNQVSLTFDASVHWVGAPEGNSPIVSTYSETGARWPVDGDWDGGYYKLECGGDHNYGYMKGISLSANSWPSTPYLQAHRILCAQITW